MKKYKSRIGWGILIPILVVYISILTFVLFQEDSLVKYLISGFLILTLAFILFMFFRTDYTITDDRKLLIRNGVIRFPLINITSIDSIEKTTSLESSPAPSIQGRIRLKYRKLESVIISPLKTEEFIEDLLKINPEIKLS
jgi:hypothetical protein